MTDLRFTDELIGRLERAREWPLKGEQEIIEQIALWIAFREGNAEALRAADEWQNQTRKYRVDSLPHDISEAFANLIFGGPVKVKTANPADQERMDEIIGAAKGNNLSSQLGLAHETSSSEGEIWWRLYVDPEVAAIPLIEWWSRTAVVPHWVGRTLKAVAFVNELDMLPDDEEGVAWRHFEIHEDGAVTNVLFKGRDDMATTTYNGLGDVMVLEAHPQTERLLPVWEHGLDGMLAGRVINKEGPDPRIGKSDYQRLEDYFFMLNETLAVGHENMRLTAKKRVVVESSALDPQGNLDASQEVLVADRSDRVLGSSEGGGPWRVLEYSFDADALIAYKKDLVESACSRVGLQAQFVAVGDATEGFAQSGTALKVRLLPSVNAASGRAENWDAGLPKLLHMVQQLDALDESNLGLGIVWSDANTQPIVERPEMLPEDPTEESTRHADLVEAKLESRQTAITELRPEWDEERVKEEIARIKNEDRTFAPSLSTLLPPLVGEGEGADPQQNADGASEPTPAQAG